MCYRDKRWLRWLGSPFRGTCEGSYPLRGIPGRTPGFLWLAKMSLKIIKTNVIVNWETPILTYINYSYFAFEFSMYVAQ